MEGMFFSFIYCKNYQFDLIIDAAASRSLYSIYINEVSCTALIEDGSH